MSNQKVEFWRAKNKRGKDKSNRKECLGQAVHQPFLLSE